MIVLEVDSGLGNQMFKYAAAKALAQKHNADLYLDVDVACLEGYGIGQSFQLNRFNIKAGYATRSIMKQFDQTNAVSALYVLVRRRLRELRIVRALATRLRKSGLNVSKVVPVGTVNGSKVFLEAEEDWAFKPEFLDLPDDILIKGYFPSYKYFEAISDTIVDEFTLKAPLSAQSRAIEEDIINSNSISIHFRRGDVVANPKYRSWYDGVVTDNYYLNAIKFFAGRVENPHFFIFSNDMEWVKQNFKMPGKVTYVDHNPPESGFEDLHLMSKCKHNVTTGCSSFSWWGAYLNPNPNKIVLRAARMNFHPHLDNPGDFYPPSWTVIES